MVVGGGGGGGEGGYGAIKGSTCGCYRVVRGNIKGHIDLETATFTKPRNCQIDPRNCEEIATSVSSSRKFLTWLLRDCI